MGAASTTAIMVRVSTSVSFCSRFRGLGRSTWIAACLSVRPWSPRKTKALITSSGMSAVLAKIASPLTNASLSGIPASIINPRKMIPL
ncbi:hypothetical protein D9M71_775740 [compost metagenome]